jgi:hypothetical protein
MDSLIVFEFFNELGVVDRRDPGRVYIVARHEGQMAPRLGAEIFHGPGYLELNRTNRVNRNLRMGEITRSKNYSGIISKRYYCFIGLDNGSGKFTPEAVDLARETLTNQKTCLVAFHYPPAVGRWGVHAMIDDQKGGQCGYRLKPSG